MSFMRYCVMSGVFRHISLMLKQTEEVADENEIVEKISFRILRRYIGEVRKIIEGKLEYKLRQ